MEHLEAYQRTEFQRMMDAWSVLFDLYESLDPDDFAEERSHILAVRIMLNGRAKDLLRDKE